MLSLQNVGNGTIAANYYEASDDYYASGHGPSQWWGNGAAILGLQGAVVSAEFTALLDGQLPSGEALQHAAAGRRGGTDGTFSAPKSVSLQALVGGDERVIKAHCLAFDRALAYAETLVACCVTENGITHSKLTGNLVVARFDHDLSRACDPQLHTHCVMINATRRSSGQWRAVNNEAIYRNKMLLGALYRAELARELQELGYSVRLTHIDGRFELANITERQVKAFSQRSAAIETYLKTHQGLERDDATAWTKKLAAVVTRDKKTNVDRNDLRKERGMLSAAEGITYKVPEPSANLNAKPEAATAVLASAIAHVGERQSVFSRQAIVQNALERGVGVATLYEIETALYEAIKSGMVICEDDRYTTPGAQRQEREILDIESRGRTTLRPIYQGERTALLEQMASLSDGQRDAVLGVLLTSNQIIGIQGRAGVGKTTLLAVAAERARASGYIVKGLAPSASAARELNGAGIDAETIAAFSNRQTKKLDARTLLIVDEAGMVSTRQMHAILTEAAVSGCRVALVGDTAQLQSVEAGKPFAQLQASGMHTAAVNQIQRQKNSRLKRAVELAVGGQTAMAV
jgi:conjugative relaxase-like TrwC/TraI family protein